MMRTNTRNALWIFFVYILTFMYSRESHAAALSGAYTINPALPATGVNFRNIGSAVAFLTGNGSRTDAGPDNSAPFGISAPVTFFIAPGSYPEQLVLQGTNIPGLSAANTLTFDGGNAETTTLSFDSEEPVIQVKLCSYVTLRNIGVTNMNPDQPSGIYIYGSAAALNNGTGCKIKRCRVTMGNLNGQASAIAVTDSNNTVWQSKAMADSIEIDSNTTTGGYYSLVFHGAVSSAYNHGIKVRHNTFIKSFNGVLFSKINNGIDFMYNTVANTGQDGPTTTLYDIVKFASCLNTGPVSNRVIGNRLDADTRGLNLEYCASTAAFPFLVYNNMITARSGGILIAQPLNVINYCQVYHNTVYCSNPLEGTFVAATPFSYSNQASGQLSCMNNIFAVAATKDTSFSMAFSIAGDSNLAAVNYNVYYNPSAGSGRLLSRKNVNYTAATYRTKAAGGDSSTIQLPGFVSAADLHLSHGCQFRGTDLRAYVPYDIDSNLRPANPYAGCDEFITSDIDLFAEAITEPALPATGPVSDLSIKVRNNGSTPVYSFNAGYELNGNPAVNQAWSGMLNPCDTTIVTFTGSNQMNIPNGISSLKAFVSSPNGSADTIPSNDTISIAPMSGTYTIGDTLCDYKTFANALSDLYSRGICGATTFLLKPGIYPEQVYVNGTRIKGLIATNPLTFDGGHADSTFIIANRKSAAAVVIHYARYVTFKNLGINNPNPVAGAGVGIVCNTLSVTNSGKGCKIKNCKVSVAGAGSTCVNITSVMNGFSMNGGAVADSIEIDSNDLDGGVYGISMQGGNGVAYNRGITIRGNTFNHHSTTSIYLYWIYNAIIINNNTFKGNNSASTITFGGLVNQSSAATEIIGNRFEAQTPMAFYAFSSFNTSPAYPARINNNYFINAITPIYITQGAATAPPVTYFEVYHNSINVNLTGSTVGYGIYFSNINTISTLLARNNIIAVTAKTGQAIPMYLNSPVNIGNLNYNLYYNSTGPALLFRSGSYTASTFNTAAAGGNQSYNELPDWVSDTNLHITSGCRFKGQNLSASVPLDIEGTLRTTTPDIGCYEFGPSLNDLAAEELASPKFPIVSGIQDLKVKIRNNGSGSISSFTLAYELNGNPPVATAWTGTLNPCDTATVIFSGANIGASNSIKIYTSTPNGTTDTYMNNDTLKLKINATMSGVYTIGDTLSDYKTFGLAVDALTANGISGPVTFLVRSGLYTEQVEVSSNVAGMSAAAGVTFQSAANNRDSVILQFKSGANNNYIFRFNYASWFTLRNLSIIAMDSLYAKVIDITGNSSFDTIYGCRIASSSTLGGDRSGIYANAITGKRNVIMNNSITKGNTGIYWFGVSQTDVTDSNQFIGNYIGGASAYSFYTNYNNNVKFRKNTVEATSANHRALYCTNMNNAFEITGNKISVSAGGYGMWVNLCNGNISRKALIANNVILMGGPSSASINGIFLAQTSNVLLCHNSVHVTGGSIASGYAAYINNITATSLNNLVYNNIFSNTGGGCAVYYQTIAANAFSNRMDYNLLYASGASLAEKPAAYPNPSKLPDLATWRTKTTQDLHSISYRPAFTSASNLMPNALDSAVWAINGRGMHLDSTYTDTRNDATGTARALTPQTGVPDLGAFETEPASLPPAAVAKGVAMHDSTQVFLFGSDTVARIRWGSTVNIPTAVIVKQYSGIKAPALDTASRYMYFYTSILAPQGTYDPYQLEIYYKEPWLGTIEKKADLRLAHKPTGLPWNSAFVAGANPADTINNILPHPLGNTFGFFTGTDMNVPLPVKLMGFTGAPKNKTALLSWITASEKNSACFILERSHNNRQWEKAGTVKAAGNSSSVSTYSFTDELAFASGPVIYYRLKIIDMDGSYSYSVVITLLLNQPQTATTVSVYPNPFNNEIVIVCTNGFAGITATIYDITGKAVRSSASYPANNGVHVMDTRELQPGIYFLETETNGTKHIDKLIKQ